MTGSEDTEQHLQDFSFPKEERLNSKKVIQELFQKGSSFTLYPFKVIYHGSRTPVTGYPQVLFSIPKRNFRKANVRNLVRRRCKEAYRLHKHPLHSPADSSSATLPISEIAFIYTGKEIFLFKQIEKKLSLAIERLAKIRDIASE